MGTGYSGNFIGTAGSIGNNQFYQISITDELPVRRKSTGMGSGATDGKRNESELIITAEMILMRCERCRLEKISPEDLVAWLIRITSSEIIVQRTARAVVKKHIQSIETSVDKKSFWERLSKFEKDLQVIV